MRTLLFIATHLGSGFQHLYEVLDSHAKIQGFENKGGFTHPDVAMNVMALPHKDRTSTAIYMATLLKNESLTCNEFCKFSKFIYLMRPAKFSINVMVQNDGYAPQQALNYYMFRLRRLSQLAKLTPGALFLTYDDLVRNEENKLIEEYLNLKTPLESQLLPFEDMGDVIHTSIIEKGQEVYEKYLRYMNGLDLLKVL